MLNFMRVSLVIEELLPFDRINFNIFSVFSKRWNFMKLILNIFDYGVVMHMGFHQGVISYRGVIAL